MKHSWLFTILLILTISGLFAQDGLVAYYPFNGNTLDESGNGNDGSEYGVSLIEDRFGNMNSAYSFDGVDDYIHIPITKNEHEEFTINIWADGYGTIICPKTSEYESYFGKSIDDTLFYHLGWFVDGYPFHNKVYPSGTYDMYTLKGYAINDTSYGVQAYFNGQYLGSREYPYRIPSWQFIEIARNPVEENNHYSGNIDDISIYNRMLSAAEIDSLYHESGWDTEPDLVAYYPFNGNANDESGNGNDGDTFGPAPTPTQDRFGNENSAYHFDGSDDYIQIPHSPALDSMSQITVSLWIKPESEAPYYFPYHIIEKYGSWNLGQRQRDIRWAVDSFDSYTDHWVVGLDLDTYYHIVMTYDDIEMRIYVNNTLETAIEVAGSVTPSISDIYIGEYTFGGNYFYNGVIDDIRIYNRALSDSEIYSLYHEGGWPVLNNNNLVLNPGFEDGLNEWNPYQNTSGWDTSNIDSYNGNNCLVFTFPSGSGYYDAGIKQEGDHLYIEAGVPYYFSYWRRDINTHDTHTTAETILDTDIRINGVNYSHPMPDMSPSEIWKHIDTTMIFPVSGYAELDFQLHGYTTSNSALFALDDIELRRITENLTISLPHLIANANDTVLVPVSVSLADSLFDSAEIRFSGYHNGLEYLGIDTSGTMMGGLGWTWSENESDTLLLTAFAGSNDITGDGVFCYLRFLVPGEICTDVPIEIVYAKFNSTEITEIEDGSIYIQPAPVYGDVDGNGDIEAHDAALVLKHIAHGGEDSLFCQDAANADVNQSEEIEALDASIILQYVVQLIDSLPVEPDSPALIASGNVSMENINAIAGTDFELPVFLQNGDNILSFEGRIEYDPSVISPQLPPIVWSNLLSGFTVEIDTEEPGVITFAGASANPDGASGIFATLMFNANDEFSEDDVAEIIITSIRFNGNVHYENIVAYVNGVVGVDNMTVPTQYSLDQNYPNPFNPSTTLRYGIPEQSRVTMRIYDISGREIKSMVNKLQLAGWYEMQWNGIDDSGKQVSAGMYFVRLTAGEYSTVIKMVHLK